MSRNRWLGVAIAIGAATLSSPAGAHGPAPAVVAPIAYDEGATDDDAPWLIQLSAGYARRSETGYAYLCPSALDLSLGSGIAVGLGPDRALVAGGDAVYTLTKTEIAPHAMAPDAETILALRPGPPGTALALVTGATRSIWSIASDDAFSVHDASTPWTAIAWNEGALWLARVEGGDVVVASAAWSSTDTLSTADFTETTIPAEDTSGRTASLSVTEAGLVLWLRGTDDADGYWLSPSHELMSFGRFASPAYGPVAFTDGARVLDGEGQLWRLEDDGTPATEPPATEPEAAGYTCLGRVGASRFACAFDRLLALSSDAEPSALFALEDLTGPDPQVDLEEAAAQSCELDWIDFATHAGLEISPDEQEPSDAATDDDGCGCSVPGLDRDPSRASSALVALIVCAAWRRRRKRG